ncbi:Copper amine oxidase, N3 domain [Natribacillus halophilus]|uniref:Amine oxidase n=1 Tax=Natribacillus halophilus TaxID=549003 RepID=A0A1G8RAD1_9BACI|nr:Copper amine oxidase, N3 domain [Natribacillus halophilus]
MVDGWAPGIKAEGEERRVSRALCFVRMYAGDNAYAYPLTGLIPVVDLNTMEVIRIEDYGAKPLPPMDASFKFENSDDLEPRSDLKPIDITQPEGPSFETDGHFIKWQKWNIRFGYTAREGLVLHQVSYEDKGEERPVLYRAALSEMVVPYGETSPAHNWQNALDAGEYGIGQLANSLTLGCDCLGEVRYFNAVMADGKGDVHTIPNAICLHEEDDGTAWKKTDWRTDEGEERRSRRLVLSFFATVLNYDYGFYWYFYTDGRIEQEVKLTGILNVGALEEGEKPKYGTEVAPRINGPIYQHFFNFRLDMNVDGQKNSVVELNTVAEKEGSDNPNKNAFHPVTTTFKKEKDRAQHGS